MIAAKSHDAALSEAANIRTHVGKRHTLIVRKHRNWVEALKCIVRCVVAYDLWESMWDEVRLWAKHEEKGGEVWGVDVEVRTTHLLLFFSG